MKLEYIKINGNYYFPQKAGIRNEKSITGNYPVCIIKKRLFGGWQIDYFDADLQCRINGGIKNGDEDTPNRRLIVYTKGIEEISYINKQQRQ